MLKDFFFDQIFKIIFGNNAYENIEEFDYFDPFEGGKRIKSSIKDTILRLLDDFVKSGF